MGVVEKALCSLDPPLAVSSVGTSNFDKFGEEGMCKLRSGMVRTGECLEYFLSVLIPF